MATPLDPLGQPGVPDTGRTLRRWGALLALAGAALPGVEVGGPAPPDAAAAPPAAVAAPASEAPVSLLPDENWEAVLVEPTPAPTGVPATAPAPATPGEQARALHGGSGLVPESREHLRRWLVGYAEENGLPADLVMAQAWKESSWRAGAVSEDGAAGVMQLMPRTAEYVCRKLLKLSHTLDPLDPAANIRMGTRFMRYLVERFEGDYRQALMAYNQGVTSLLTNGPYREAKAYADAIFALRPQFQSS